MKFDDGNDPHEIKLEMFQVVLAKTRKMQTVGGWTSIDDKLPAVGARCLVVHEPVYLNETDVTICRKIMISAYMECGKEHFFVDLRSPLFPVPVVLNKVTHWMLLPELPKEDDDAGQ